MTRRHQAVMVGVVVASAGIAVTLMFLGLRWADKSQPAPVTPITAGPAVPRSLP